jgi:hypothetical protein
MQVRFRLPADETIFPGNPVGINQTAISFIERDMQRWGDRYQQQYTLKNDGRYLYLTLEDTASISFFLLTYKPQYHSSSRKRIEVVDAQNNLITDFLSV